LAVAVGDGERSVSKEGSAGAADSGAEGAVTGASGGNSTDAASGGEPRKNVLTHAQEVLSRFESTVITLLIPVGIIGSMFGIVVFKPALLVAGAIGGGSLTYVLMWRATVDTVFNSWAPIVVGILGIVVGGFLAYKLAAVGVFAIGSSLGVAIALLLGTTQFYKNASPENPAKVLYVTASVLGFITGVASLFFQRGLIIISMAYSGSFATVYGIGHFFGRFPDLQEFNKAGFFKSSWLWFWFVWFVLQAAVGMYMQFMILHRAAPEVTSKREEDGSNSFYFSNGNDADNDDASATSGNNEWSNNWADEDEDEEVGPVIGSVRPDAVTPAPAGVRRMAAGHPSAKRD